MGGSLSGNTKHELKKLSKEYDCVSVEDLERLHKSLKDRNPSGLMTRTDLERSLPKVPNKKILDSLYVFFDTDKDGKITILEYVVGMVRFCFGTPKQKLKYVFTIFDLDRNGVISKSEMKEGIKLMFEVSPKKNKQMLKKIFKTLDEDGDNEISLEEFQKVVLKDSKLATMLTSVINPHF